MTWQGWTLLGVYGAVVIAVSYVIQGPGEDPELSRVLAFVAFVFVAMGTLIFLVSRKAPQGKWRWGKSDSDDPEEDF